MSFGDGPFFTPPSSASPKKNTSFFTPNKAGLKTTGLEDDYHTSITNKEQTFNNNREGTDCIIYNGTDSEEEEEEDEDNTMENFTSKLMGLTVSDEKSIVLPHLMYRTTLDSCGKKALCIDVQLPSGADENDIHIEFVEDNGSKGSKQKLLVKYLYSFPFLSMRIFESAHSNTRDQVAIAFARKSKIREAMKTLDESLVTEDRPKHVCAVMEIPLPIKCVNFADESLLQIEGSGAKVNRYVYGDDDDPAEMLCANIVLVEKEDKKKKQRTPMQPVRNYAANGLGLDALKREFNDF